MGVIIQEQVPATSGGVMVTTNPLIRKDFRNIYINVATEVTDVVDGAAAPSQYLFNTVGGGGRTAALGESDVDDDTKRQLPLCITARLPAIPPFTEDASTAPCTLPEHLQRRVEEVSRDAVDALQLDT